MLFLIEGHWSMYNQSWTTCGIFITPLLANKSMQGTVIFMSKAPEAEKAKVRLFMVAVTFPAAPSQHLRKRTRWACWRSDGRAGAVAKGVGRDSERRESAVWPDLTAYP